MKFSPKKTFSFQLTWVTTFSSILIESLIENISICGKKRQSLPLCYVIEKYRCNFLVKNEINRYHKPQIIIHNNNFYYVNYVALL